MLTSTENLIEKEVKTFDLVRGTYTAEEAKEIVNHLFYKKISFHNHKSFAKILKDGTKNMDSEKRVIELEEARNELIEAIDKAMKEGKMININSNISLATK